MSDKILVTGASGFIGGLLSNSLLEKGYDVQPVDIDTKTNYNFTVSKCDITNFNEVKNFVKECTHVVHLAGIVDVKSSLERPQVVWGVNSQGTANLLEASRISRIKKFVYASTNSVYGQYPYIEGGITEDYPICPVNPYGASKASGELLIESYRKTFNMRTVCLRFAGVYGPGKLGNVFDIFVRKALAGDDLTVTGKNQSRNFTYIDDALNSLKLALFEDADGIFNISGGKSIKVLSIAEEISKHIKNTKVVVTKNREGDAKLQGLLNIDKARRELGYIPQTDVQTGVRRYIEWYQNKRE